MSKKRAPAGSGSVLKWKKNGQVVGWIGVADLGVVDGKRRRQKVYGKTQAEVQKRLGEILHKKEAGTLAKPGRLTVADWLAAWLKGLDVRARTREGYELIIRKHIVPVIGSRPLGKLTAADVRALLNEKKAGMAPRSRVHVRAVLRTALGQAVLDRKIPFNVAAETKRPKVPRKEMKTLDRDQVHQLLVALRGTPLEALFVLAVGLGLREGELLGLRWSDIRPKIQEDGDAAERRWLTVSNALQWLHVTTSERRREAALVEPKSETSRRTLPLSGPAVDALRVHRKRWVDEKLRLGDRWVNDWDLVFVGPQGEPLHAKYVWREWRRILTAAKLPTIRPHDLRHTAGTLLREQGVDIKVIQETLGHSSISTTLDTYGHVTPGLREQAVGAQAAILGARS